MYKIKQIVVLVAAMFLHGIGAATPTLAAEPAGQSATIFYIEPSAAYYGVQLPKYAPVALQDIAFELVSPLTTEKGLEAGLRTGLTFGWKPGVTLAGSPLTLETSIFYASMDNSRSTVFDYSIANRIGWYNINGVSSVVGFGGGDDLNVSSHRDVLHMGMDIVAKRPFQLGDSSVMTPFAGFSTMMLNQRFRTEAYEVQTPANGMDLSEKVDATYHGLSLGARIDYKLTPEVLLSSTLGGALYYAHAAYQGYQVSSGPTILDYTAALRREADKIAGRVQLDCAAQYNSGPWSFGAFGGVEYLSYVPRIIASNIDSVGGIGTANGRPTHLGASESLGWKAGLNFALHF